MAQESEESSPISGIEESFEVKEVPKGKQQTVQESEEAYSDADEDFNMSLTATASAMGGKSFGRTTPDVVVTKPKTVTQKQDSNDFSRASGSIHDEILSETGDQFEVVEVQKPDAKP